MARHPARRARVVSALYLLASALLVLDQVSIARADQLAAGSSNGAGRRRSLHQVTEEERIAAQERFLFGDTHFHAYHAHANGDGKANGNHPNGHMSNSQVVAGTAQPPPAVPPPAAKKGKSAKPAAVAKAKKAAAPARVPAPRARNEHGDEDRYDDKHYEHEYEYEHDDEHEDYEDEDDEEERLPARRGRRRARAMRTVRRLLPGKRSRSRSGKGDDADAASSERSGLVKLVANGAWLALLLGSYAYFSTARTSSLLLSWLFPVFSFFGRLASSCFGAVYGFARSATLHSLRPVRMLVVAPVAYLLVGLYYVLLDVPLRVLGALAAELYPLYLFLGAAATIGITLGAAAATVLLLGSFVFTDKRRADAAAAAARDAGNAGRAARAKEHGKARRVNEKGTTLEPSDIKGRGDGAGEKQHRRARSGSAGAKGLVSKTMRQQATRRRSGSGLDDMFGDDKRGYDNGYGFDDDDDDEYDERDGAGGLQPPIRRQGSGMWSEESGEGTPPPPAAASGAGAFAKFRYPAHEEPDDEENDDNEEADVPQRRSFAARGAGAGAPSASAQGQAQRRGGSSSSGSGGAGASAGAFPPMGFGGTVRREYGSSLYHQQQAQHAQAQEQGRQPAPSPGQAQRAQAQAQGQGQAQPPTSYFPPTSGVRAHADQPQQRGSPALPPGYGAVATSPPAQSPFAHHAPGSPIASPVRERERERAGAGPGMVSGSGASTSGSSSASASSKGKRRSMPQGASRSGGWAPSGQAVR